jgi:hypothetical protein
MDAEALLSPGDRVLENSPRIVPQLRVANLREVDAIALGAQRIKTLAYAVEESELSWQFDLVVVGRDYLQQIRRRFGMPSRPRANP